MHGNNPSYSFCVLIIQLLQTLFSSCFFSCSKWLFSFSSLILQIHCCHFGFHCDLGAPLQHSLGQSSHLSTSAGMVRTSLDCPYQFKTCGDICCLYTKHRYGKLGGCITTSNPTNVLYKFIQTKSEYDDDVSKLIFTNNVNNAVILYHTLKRLILVYLLSPGFYKVIFLTTI